MRIGIDFDNTIVCYDGVFHAAALERGLIPVDLPYDKNSVRDHLNDTGRNDEFTELQGYVYGARMDLAALYPGVLEFIANAQMAGHEIFVVSHKSRYPFKGPHYDLHDAARKFLGRQRYLCALVEKNCVYFELTKIDKVARAAALKVDVFIDDLPEILDMAGWPAATRKILFDPERRFAEEKIYECYSDWESLGKALLDA